jgi:site-specific DNA recombinase
MGIAVFNGDAEGVRWAFEHYAQGETSFRLVAAELNARGFTNRGAPFSTFGVEEMLKNPVYIGSVRCKEYIHPNAHPPLIEQATWDAVQELILRRGTRRLSTRPVPANGDRGLLTDLAFCARCGARMWYQPNTCATTAVVSVRATVAATRHWRMRRATEIITLATLAALALPASTLGAGRDRNRAE